MNRKQLLIDYNKFLFEKTKWIVSDFHLDEFLKTLPQEAEEGGWISVEERLPDNEAECFVWYVSPNVRPHIRTATYMGNKYFSVSGIQDTTRVIAYWHPMIPPPPSPLK